MDLGVWLIKNISREGLRESAKTYDLDRGFLMFLFNFKFILIYYVFSVFFGGIGKKVYLCS